MLLLNFFFFFFATVFLWPNDKQKIAHDIIIISGQGYILNKIENQSAYCAVPQIVSPVNEKDYI